MKFNVLFLKLNYFVIWNQRYLWLECTLAIWAPIKPSIQLQTQQFWVIRGNVIFLIGLLLACCPSCLCEESIRFHQHMSYSISVFYQQSINFTFYSSLQILLLSVCLLSFHQYWPLLIFLPLIPSYKQYILIEKTPCIIISAKPTTYQYLPTVTRMLT